MPLPDWKSFFAARADNQTGNKNTPIYTEARPPDKNDEERFQTLTSDPNMVIFAAGNNKKLLTFHSFKNAGGTLLRPDNKLMCLLGTGASATAIKVNFKEIVANSNLVIPKIEELSKCKTASEVSELEAPNETGLVTYPGSAFFLEAPWLVNTVMAANSSDPFHLIAIVNAAAKTFDEEHDADAEYITKVTDNADDFILWAWGVGAGRFTKTSFSINPNDTDLKPFKTQFYQACISTVGAAWTVPNGLPPLLQGDQTNLAVLGLLNTTTSRVTIEKKIPSYFLTTSYRLPNDFPDFASFA